MVQLLVKRGANFQMASLEDGTTPLTLAASERNLPVAQYLIECVAKVNVSGGHFGGPLRQACFLSTFEMVKALWQSMRDPADTNRSDPGKMDGDERVKEVVRHLIDETGADINLPSTKWYYDLDPDFVDVVRPTTSELSAANDDSWDWLTQGNACGHRVTSYCFACYHADTVEILHPFWHDFECKGEEVMDSSESERSDDAETQSQLEENNESLVIDKGAGDDQSDNQQNNQPESQLENQLENQPDRQLEIQPKISPVNQPDN
ncbi:hypothetical protein B0H63DRAFT_446035 [Podospora didyma]|uniref:Ankyrin repeat protein n=1 Tax=Podospora didyma TaxID=330526 RepID=A0AAE0NY51_9PEZI|nr:hypothetical protein B0H63DRAFT_446035 [Podospora didyma]